MDNHRGSEIICVDPWPDAEIKRRFDKNTAGYPYLTAYQGYSHEVLRRFPLGIFDVIYVDGNHDGKNVLEDAILSYRLLKSGGLMIFDDLRWKNPNNHPCDILPKPAIDAFISIFQHKVTVLHRGSQLLLRVQ